MPVRRCEPDVSRDQPVAFFCFLYGELSVTTEDSGHETAVPRVQMLHDDDGGRKIDGQMFKNMTYGRQSTS